MDGSVNLPYLGEVAGNSGADAGNLDTAVDTLRFFNIPARFSLRPLEGNRWGARLRAELAFGVHDFDSFLGDLDFGRVKALVLLPGVELPVRVNEWLVARPYLDLGAGMVTDGTGWAFLTRGGLALETEHHWHRLLFQTEPKLEYSLSRGRRPSLEDGLGQVGLKLGVRHPLGFALRGQRVDAGAYFDFSYFYDDVELRSPGGSSTRIDTQYEVGVSVGSVEIARIWKLSVPRIGVGYRFGDGVRGISIRLGGRF